MIRAAIVVHGGTSNTADDEAGKQRLVEEARTLGSRVLGDGGSALDAVVKAIRFLEDSAGFDAGIGSYRQADNVIRCDASLMTSVRDAGAVIGIDGIRNPILAARVVLEETPHVTLAGAVGAAVLRAYGCAAWEDPGAPGSEVDYASLVAEFRTREPSPALGTVGAAALDRYGLLAAGTSTGGIHTSLPGRAGDSGAIGPGTFATPQVAVSCTGWGERFLVLGVAQRLADAIEFGVEAMKAADDLRALLELTDSPGGFIVVTASGEVIIRQTARYMRTAQGVV